MEAGGGGADQAKFHKICLTYTISKVMIYVHMVYNLKHEILAKTIKDCLFRRVMKIRFAVTLAVFLRTRFAAANP